MELFKKLKPAITLNLQQVKTTTLLTLPILLHTCYFSLLDLLTVGSHRAPPSMYPDMASLLFVTATTTLTSRALAKNRPQPPARTNAIPPLKQCLLTGLELFSNVALCELALRTVWIPVQYLLHHAKEQQLLALLVRTMFCGLSYCGSGRRVLSKMDEIAGGEAGYFIARNVVATGYLVVVLVVCGYLGQVWRRVMRK